MSSRSESQEKHSQIMFAFPEREQGGLFQYLLTGWREVSGLFFPGEETPGKSFLLNKQNATWERPDLLSFLLHTML